MGTGYSTGYDNQRYYYYSDTAGAFNSTPHDLDLTVPYSFTVDITLSLGNEAAGFGGYSVLTFNQTSSTEFYALCIGRDGAYQIYTCSGGYYTDFYPQWILHSAIKPLGQTNKVKIKQYANRTVIIINDVQVGEAAIPASSPVKVGIGSGCNETGYGYTPVTSYFDNFRIASITTN